MSIPDYRIDNILEQFGKLDLKKRLGRGEAPETISGLEEKPGDDRRRDISDRIAEDILQRVSRLERKIDDRPGASVAGSGENGQDGPGIVGRPISPGESEFSFIVVGKDNRKRTKTIPVGNPDAFLQRLERLARRSAEKGACPPDSFSHRIDKKA